MVGQLAMLNNQRVILHEYGTSDRATGVLVDYSQDGVLLKDVDDVQGSLIWYPVGSIRKIRLYTSDADAEDSSVDVVDSMETQIKTLIDGDADADSYSFDEDSSNKVSVDDSDGDTMIEGDADELSFYNDDFKDLAVKIAKVIGCDHVKRHIVEE